MNFMPSTAQIASNANPLINTTENLDAPSNNKAENIDFDLFIFNPDSKPVEKKIDKPQKIQ
ncbi:MAG: hypothetical protein ACP5K7_14240, partial [Verrucomicrobiia bacterium]